MKNRGLGVIAALIMLSMGGESENGGSNDSATPIPVAETAAPETTEEETKDVPTGEEDTSDADDSEEEEG